MAWGSFDMDVKDGESYTAKVTLPGGLIKAYPLPPLKTLGTVLQVKNNAERDSITVTAMATNDIVQAGSNYYLIGTARGIVCYAAILNFNMGNTVKRNIAKSLFPSGITHFIIMDTKYQPLNERLVYIDHQDNLRIQFTVNKTIYAPKDSVSLNIKVTDRNGSPGKRVISLLSLLMIAW